MKPSPFSARAVITGTLLSICLACGALYGNMVIRGSYMALDFSAAGALFLFFLLVGVLNVAAHWMNPAFALRRDELIVVYIMLIVASALPTMGLSEYLVTIISGAQYYATPENEWATLIHPYLPDWIGPRSETAVKWFYEGAPKGSGIPWQAWARPLAYWCVPIASLYLVMISSMVILRRQWVENERLIFPIVQLPIEMTRSVGDGRSLPQFFRNPVMWAGFAVPVIVSTLQGLHAYYNFIPGGQLLTTLPIFRNTQSLIFRLSFPMVGFSFLINLDIAFSLWFFNLVAKCQRGIMGVLGITSTEKLMYGAFSEPILAHQGQGAMVVLVLFGLWVGREHFGRVLRKAWNGDPSINDSDEILSYRAATLSFLGGGLALIGWLWATGLPLWAAFFTYLVAILIFVGLTRIVVESGVAAAVGPMIAASVVTSAVGSSVLGPPGMVGMAYTFVWGADIRTFVMASAAHGLKLTEHLGAGHVRPGGPQNSVAGRSMRPLFWILVLVIVVTIAASTFTILVLSYRYGGLNLNDWFYGGGTRAPFNYAADNLNTPTTPNLWGWLNTLIGAGVMSLLMLARHHCLWWPLHPTGYPIAAIWLMDELWFSIFIAWLLKLFAMKYGGPALFSRARPFFLGLILGQFVIAGLWLIVDYFTSMTDNRVFWI
ncbi:MAG: DUF6785 family protein [Candidatus Latescibacterota bacterium]|nr:DUF6785 family protein [Candidatus Latescibacterota bacterium]